MISSLAEVACCRFICGKISAKQACEHGTAPGKLGNHNVNSFIVTAGNLVSILLGSVNLQEQMSLPHTIWSGPLLTKPQKMLFILPRLQTFAEPEIQVNITELDNSGAG